MNQILFFIIGIALLFVIPFIYFFQSKIFGKSVKYKKRVLFSFVFIFLIIITIVVVMNVYTYIINFQDNIVSERYVKSLIINSSNNNLEKHFSDTEYISYVDVEGLHDAFVESSKLKVNKVNGFASSEKRWLDQDEFVHHYLYVESCDICYDMGLLEKDDFWDVASISVLSEEQKKHILLHERFLKQ